MKKHFSHGEVNIFETASIPSDAKKMKSNGIGYKIADSETTGNHHMVKAKDGVEMYEKDGVMYLKNTVPVDVYCVLQDRHDTITLEPSIWEFEAAQEYDYLTQEQRNVAD